MLAYSQLSFQASIRTSSPELDMEKAEPISTLYSVGQSFAWVPLTLVKATPFPNPDHILLQFSKNKFSNF